MVIPSSNRIGSHSLSSKKHINIYTPFGELIATSMDIKVCRNVIFGSR